MDDTNMIGAFLVDVVNRAKEVASSLFGHEFNWIDIRVFLAQSLSSETIGPRSECFIHSRSFESNWEAMGRIGINKLFKTFQLKTNQ